MFLFFFCKLPFSPLFARPYTRIYIPRTRFSLTFTHIYYSFFFFPPFLFIFVFFFSLVHASAFKLDRFLFFLVSGICFINAYSMSRGILSMQRKNKKFADFYDHVYNVSKMRGVINWRLLLLLLLLLLLYSVSSRRIKCFVS